MEKKVRTIVLHRKKDGLPIQCPINMEIGPNTEWEGATVHWYNESNDKIIYNVKETISEIQKIRSSKSNNDELT